MTVEINPSRLPGDWDAGYALDVHTLRSEFLGHNEYGEEEYDTRRSAVGELLYRLKYRGDRSVVRVLAEAAAGFVLGRNWPVDVLVMVPPTRTERRFQPVRLLARETGSLLKKSVYPNCVVKVQATPELKTVRDFAERLRLLEGAYAVSTHGIRDRSVLLIDDLYRSGATLAAVTQALRARGEVKRVYVLTFTRTRVNR